MTVLVIVFVFNLICIVINFVVNLSLMYLTPSPMVGDLCHIVTIG